MKISLPTILVPVLVLALVPICASAADVDYSSYGEEYAKYHRRRMDSEAYARAAAAGVAHEQMLARLRAIDEQARKAVSDEMTFPPDVAQDLLRKRLSSIPSGYSDYFTECYKWHKERTVEVLREQAEAREAEKVRKANDLISAIEKEAARPSREAAFADVKAGKISKAEAMKRMGLIPTERAAIVAQYKEGRIGYDDALNTLRGVPVKNQSVSAEPAKGIATPSSAVSSPPAKKG